MASLSYANTGSGAIAGALGWINFGALTLAPNQTVSGVTATLLDGSTVTFDLTNSYISGQSASFVATQPPTFAGSPFGTAGYTGINGNVAMWATLVQPGRNRLTLRNITVTDPNGIRVPNFNFYVTDAEATSAINQESQVWSTDGSPWSLLTVIGGGNSPSLSGVGTQTATLTGVSQNYNAPVLSTLNPGVVTADLIAAISGRQAVAFGISITKVQIQKVIAGRLNAADQFQLNIAGTPPATAVTTGSSVGLQPVTAYSYAPGAGAFTLSEAMAPGSVSTLSQYSTTVTYSNATPGGSPAPPSGTLPGNVNLALGDDLIATVTNTPLAAPIIVVNKAVSKTVGKVLDVLTYTVRFTNVGTASADNIIITDPIPSGTAYVGGSISSNVLFTGDPTTAITLTNSVLPGETVTFTYQVTVTTMPVPNPIPNTASVAYDYIPAAGSPPIDVVVNSNTVTTLILAPSRGVLFI